MKPFLVPVARFNHYPACDVWMETDVTTDMNALTDLIWSGNLFHDNKLRQLSWVARVDVANGKVDDWTGAVALELAHMSYDKREAPHDDLADWLTRQGVAFYQHGED